MGENVCNIKKYSNVSKLGCKVMIDGYVKSVTVWWWGMGLSLFPLSIFISISSTFCIPCRHLNFIFCILSTQFCILYTFKLHYNLKHSCPQKILLKVNPTDNHSPVRGGGSWKDLLAIWLRLRHRKIE